ncbi:MAG TPA: dolichyl-phosphate beta-glucosyltransferase [Planktothrix sp.]|jgi:glycosyltransferase involved in cell wall biosynthesis
MSVQPVFLSIVIPAFNEERRLPRALRETIEHLKKRQYTSEILVVTDGSRDRTVDVAREFAREFNVRVLEFTNNRGKGFAVKEGMLAAGGKFRLFMDADYAVPIEFVDDFLVASRSGADVVIASRCHPNTHLDQVQAFPRRQLANAFGYLQQFVLRMPYRDTQCGFKLFTAEAAERLFPLQTLDCAYFDAELLYIAYKLGVKVVEAPVRWNHDPETRLPIGLKRTVDLLKKLWGIKRDHANVRSTAASISKGQVTVGT